MAKNIAKIFFDKMSMFLSIFDYRKITLLKGQRWVGNGSSLFINQNVKHGQRDKFKNYRLVVMDLPVQQVLAFNGLRYGVRFLDQYSGFSGPGSFSVVLQLFNNHHHIL
ncbi:hypothetical protein HUG17_9111 [Dermatophagoides farinae]|uniref:Uncharacterized protein n=1 Tax=Dermatophagoides farinae TaxID=6954 RepID=A0A9D4NU67_DERFA|nr:hypothetical protein HUG17_9111 [Dermatophagoides farinae]